MKIANKGVKNESVDFKGGDFQAISAAACTGLTYTDVVMGRCPG